MYGSNERDPGRCAYCGSELALEGDEPGVMSYWVCASEGCECEVVLFPDCVGYAAALVTVQITDGEFTPNSQFDPDGCDPAGFVDRVCERLTLTWDSTREHNRKRKRPTDGQPTIGEWSA